MLDSATLLFVLACVLFIGSWFALAVGLGTVFSVASGARDDWTDEIALLLSGAMMGASGWLHWHVGTWGWFAWPWVAIALFFAYTIARSAFVLRFRIGAPVFLVAVSAALLLPIFN